MTFKNRVMNYTKSHMLYKIPILIKMKENRWKSLSPNVGIGGGMVIVRIKQKWQRSSKKYILLYTICKKKWNHQWI